jgi:quercetin dioxygenase-like cupin family protein
MSPVAFAALAFAAAAAPDLSTLDPQALRAIIPADIPWKPAAGLDGAESATLVGDPAGPGFYVVMNRFHPGHFSKPHYHPNDRYILVVSGTWWVGTGTRYDPEHDTVPLKPGTFVTHLARHVHFDGARTGSDDAVVMIFGQGPGARTDCAAETGPGPCADARAAGR